eukprot:CAMPEP_0118972814 /NCGR_PEP_ID=MMETSP1173-20130426/9014_1 /TAXON_ID=1034831 /ORGANISM="Rhizochromulina marina cf, Strain CCMP1243" /LENGTH=66 /DNA_ID=CAMNT_0006922397 /DNA_START=4 /DNA_END=201 /DNA_ORIENTATION=-
MSLKKAGLPSLALTPTQINEVFGNAEGLLDLNRDLLRSLEGEYARGTDFCETFIKFAPSMEIYAEY